MWIESENGTPGFLIRAKLVLNPYSPNPPGNGSCIKSPKRIQIRDNGREIVEVPSVSNQLNHGPLPLSVSNCSTL